MLWRGSVAIYKLLKRNRISKRCSGAELIQEPHFKSRAIWDLELTIKSSTCSFETAARMTFHLPSMNPVAAVAEAHSLRLYCISGCHGKSPPSRTLLRRQGGNTLQRRVSESETTETDRSIWKIMLRFLAEPSHPYCNAKMGPLAKQAHKGGRPHILFTAVLTIIYLPFFHFI